MDLIDAVSPGLTARLALAKHGFSFTRALGQNFMLDDEWVEALLDAAGVSPGDRVLEIGPGAGVMTAHLAARGAQVLSVELDESLRPVLDAVLAGVQGVSVIYADALKLDLGETARGAWSDGYRAISNLPYYITSELIRALVACAPAPGRIDVLVQREAAERLVALPGEPGWCELAALIRLYGVPEAGLHVPPTAFTPRPHVESCLLHIVRHASPPVEPQNPALLRAVVRAAFAMRRKTMVNNLCASFSMPRERALQWMERAGLAEKVRGEALSLAELSSLSDAMAEDGLTAGG